MHSRGSRQHSTVWNGGWPSGWAPGCRTDAEARAWLPAGGWQPGHAWVRVRCSPSWLRSREACPGRTCSVIPRKSLGSHESRRRHSSGLGRRGRCPRPVAGVSSWNTQSPSLIRNRRQTSNTVIWTRAMPGLNFRSPSYFSLIIASAAWPGPWQTRRAGLSRF